MEFLRGIVSGHPESLGIAVGAVVVASAAWLVYRYRRDRSGGGRG